MDTDQLKQAVETAKRSGISPREAFLHWELAGGIGAGETASHWAVIAIELAAQNADPDALSQIAARDV